MMYMCVYMYIHIHMCIYVYVYILTHMCETVLRNQIIQHKNNNPGENRNKTTENTSKHFQVVPNRGLLCSFPFSRAVQVVKNLSASAGDTKDMSLILGSRRPPAGGNGNLFQYSCSGNPMDRGTWRAAAHRVAKS